MRREFILRALTFPAGLDLVAVVSPPIDISCPVAFCIPTFSDIRPGDVRENERKTESSSRKVFAALPAVMPMTSGPRVYLTTLAVITKQNIPAIFCILDCFSLEDPRERATTRELGSGGSYEPCRHWKLRKWRDRHRSFVSTISTKNSLLICRLEWLKIEKYVCYLY